MNWSGVKIDIYTKIQFLQIFKEKNYKKGMYSITLILKSLQVSQDISQFDRSFSSIMRNFYIKLILNKTCFISLMQTMFCFIISLSYCSTSQQPDALRKKDSKKFLICSFFSIKR